MLDLEKIKEYYTDENLEHVGEGDTLIQAIMYDIPDLITEVERLLEERRETLSKLGESWHRATNLSRELSQAKAVGTIAQKTMARLQAERDSAVADLAEARRELAVAPYIQSAIEIAGAAYLEKLAAELDDPEGAFLRGEGREERPVGIISLEKADGP